MNKQGTFPLYEPPKDITIKRHGHTLSITPPWPALMQPFCTTSHAARDENGRCAVTKERLQLVYPAEPVEELPWLHGKPDPRNCADPPLECLAGLLPLILTWLERKGVRVTVEGSIPAALPEPAGGSIIDPEFIRFVGENERGLVRYDSAIVRPEHLVAQAATSWRDASIIVPLATLREVNHYAASLSRLVGSSVGRLHHRHHPSGIYRIAVGTPGRLGGGEGDPEHRDLLFLPTPLAVISQYYGMPLVLKAARARLFGFLPLSQRITAYERDICMALFGPAELIVAQRSKASRPPQVVFLPVRGGPEVAAAQERGALLRNGVFAHPVRNRHIARLGRYIAEGTRDAIAKRYPRVARLVSQSHRNRVGIVVANIEHALNLMERLPGWRLVARKPVADEGLSSVQRQLLIKALREPDRPRKGLVVTLAGLQRVRRLDVLIRADGGSGALFGPTKCAHTETYDGSPLTVVDFVDHTSSELYRRSGQRRHAYLSQGWHVPLELPTDLDRFLASRPTRST